MMKTLTNLEAQKFCTDNPGKVVRCVLFGAEYQHMANEFFERCHKTAQWEPLGRNAYLLQPSCTFTPVDDVEDDEDLVNEVIKALIGATNFRNEPHCRNAISEFRQLWLSDMRKMTEGK